MDNTITLIFLSAISIYGLHAIVNKIYWYNTKKTLEDARSKADNCEDVLDKWTRFVLYPVILCRPCMSSFWGTIFYWGWGWVIGGATITVWPISIIAIAGVVVLFVRVGRN